MVRDFQEFERLVFELAAFLDPAAFERAHDRSLEKRRRAARRKAANRLFSTAHAVTPANRVAMARSLLTRGTPRYLLGLPANHERGEAKEAAQTSSKVHFRWHRGCGKQLDSRTNQPAAGARVLHLAWVLAAACDVEGKPRARDRFRPGALTALAPTDLAVGSLEASACAVGSGSPSSIPSSRW